VKNSATKDSAQRFVILVSDAQVHSAPLPNYIIIYFELRRSFLRALLNLVKQISPYRTNLAAFWEIFWGLRQNYVFRILKLDISPKQIPTKKGRNLIFVVEQFKAFPIINIRQVYTRSTSASDFLEQSFDGCKTRKISSNTDGFS
jgi:hypothetical protein